MRLTKHEIKTIADLLNVYNPDVSGNDQQNALLGLSLLASIDFKTTKQLSQSIYLAKQFLKHPGLSPAGCEKVRGLLRRTKYNQLFRALRCRELLLAYLNIHNTRARVKMIAHPSKYI